MRRLVLAAAGGVLLALGPGAPDTLRQVVDPRATYPEQLGGAMQVLLALAAGWTVLVLLLDASGPAGRRLARAITPRLLRGLLAAGACGVVVAAPASAAPVASAPATVVGTDVDLDGLPMPDRPVSSEVHDAAPSPAAAPRASRRAVEVRPGDSLWALARRELGPGAAPAAVAERATDWYRANHSTVGPDPDLIRPGQLLRRPGADA